MYSDQEVSVGLSVADIEVETIRLLKLKGSKTTSLADGPRFSRYLYAFPRGNRRGEDGARHLLTGGYYVVSVVSGP